MSVVLVSQAVVVLAAEVGAMFTSVAAWLQPTEIVDAVVRGKSATYAVETEVVEAAAALPGITTESPAGPPAAAVQANSRPKMALVTPESALPALALVLVVVLALRALEILVRAVARTIVEP